MTELKILEAQVFDYGTSLGVKLTDGRALRLTANSLAGLTPAADAYEVEKVKRDRDTLLRRLAAVEDSTSR